MIKFEPDFLPCDAPLGRNSKNDFQVLRWHSSSPGVHAISHYILSSTYLEPFWLLAYVHIRVSGPDRSEKNGSHILHL